MNTDRLIEQLATNLEPVQPLLAPVRRAGWFVLSSAVYVAVLLALLARPGLASRGAEFAVLVPQLAAIVASLLAANAAYASVVPGRGVAALVWGALGTAAWIAAFVAVSLAPASQHSSVLAARHEGWCAAVILVGAVPLLAVLAASLRRGAPLHPPTTAAFGALSIGCLTNGVACVWAAHADRLSELIWHGTAILALVIACVVSAPLVLRWRRSSAGAALGA
jgi:hypothetical protein